MQRGDHLISPRTGYSHHGLYLGKNLVIHYTGFSNGRHKGEIAITSLDEFCQGEGFTVQAYPCRLYSPDESAQRALSRLGEDWYDILLNNCEHFVSWCILGVHHSHQAHSAIIAAATTKALPKELADPKARQQTSALTNGTINAPVGFADGLMPGSTLPIAMNKSSPLARMIATSGMQLLATVLVGYAISYGASKLGDWLGNGTGK